MYGPELVFEIMDFKLRIGIFERKYYEIYSLHKKLQLITQKIITLSMLFSQKISIRH